jgi:hypothetical protein
MAMTDETSGLLTAEQEAKIARIDARRERARLRKANQRRREAIAKKTNDETVESFWQRNREVGNQRQIAEVLERQEYVFALLDDVRAVTEGRAFDDEFASDVEQEILEDVAEHGICEMEVMLLEFWCNPSVFAQLTQRDDATATFVRYGVVAGIPGHRLHEWQTWLASKNQNQPSSGNGYPTLRCVNFLTCGAFPEAVPQSIAGGYSEKKIPYQCHACLGNEQKSRSLASPNVRKEALPYGNFIE